MNGHEGRDLEVLRGFAEKLGVRFENAGEVLPYCVDARGCLECARPTLRRVARQDTLDRGGARLDVEAGVRVARGSFGAVGGAAGIGHHHRQTTSDRLEDPEPERLVRAAMDQDVRARERRRELLPVALEPRKMNAGGRRLLQTLPLGSVAEKDEHRLALGAHARERLEDDVPTLFESEAPHAYEKSRPERGVAEPAPPFVIASDVRTKDLHVDAERRMNDAAHARGPQPLGLHSARDERGRVRCQEGTDSEPEGPSQRSGSPRTLPASQRRFDVGPYMIGVPEGGSDAGGVPPRGKHGGGREVRRMGFQDVGPLCLHALSNLVQASEQMVRGVVGEGRPADPHHARNVRGLRGRRRDLCAGAGIFIARPGSNHRVIVTKLAQKVTTDRQMASNPTTSLRVKLRHVDDVQAVSPAEGAGAKPVTLWPPAANTGAVADHGTGSSPFAALAARHGRPLRVAILSDFTRIPYANGAVFQTRFLYQELRRCGHEVTVIGPEDPDASPGELAPGTVALPSIPLRAYPGVHIPMPLAPWIFDPSRWNFDICFAQTTSLLLQFGTWLREMKGVPLLCVNTTHLAATYDVLLPEKLSKNELLQAGLQFAFKRPFERLFSGIYNQSDGLVVLSEGLRSYWRERGVTAPIHVIPRVVQPEIFDRPLGADPYIELIERGGLPQRGPRLVCAGRLTREKSQDRVIQIFAQHVLPQEPDATLTMVGDGPDREYYQRVAAELGAEKRVFFPGEAAWTKMPDFYRYADIFMHASLSETYGNVLGEALWCGTPTVAFADGMGVSAQIQDGENGILFAPSVGGGAGSADAAYGRAVVDLIRDPETRGRLGKAAAKRSRERCSPLAVQQRIADAFKHAQDHAVACGMRPAADRPKPVQWMTTLRHARPWTTFNGLIYLSGHLRPAKSVRRVTIHPAIGGS